MNLEKFNLLKDIYYNNDYISLYRKEDEETFDFEYKENNKIFINKSIKRAIKKIGNLEIVNDYYDLETAYGYGGFYTNTDDDSFLNRAFEVYLKKCQDEKIIAEFIRFHPFNDFPIKYKKYLNFNLHDRDTVIIDISTVYEEIKKQYSSSLKRNINKAKKNDIEYRQIEGSSENILKFYNLYYETMKKNNASSFYFFDLNYFQKLLEIENIELHAIFYKNKIINIVIIFLSENMIYYHLGATDINYYNLNSNPLLFDSIIEKYSQKYKYLYLGGGTTSNKDDSLFKFKQKFSKKLKAFYISGKIYNKDIYNKYIKLWENQSSQDIKYFLKYRLEI